VDETAGGQQRITGADDVAGEAEEVGGHS
jgi:hypothetical protein